MLAEKLGLLSRQPKRDFIAPDISKALQRNELAGERARAALEDLNRDRMGETIRGIVGKL